MPCCWSDRRILGKVLLMNLQHCAECHFRRDFAVAVASALSMLFQKFCKPRFGYAEM
jgi:hypothetical protein